MAIVKIVAAILTVCLFKVDIIDTLNNGLARTPPMGWMSWTMFYCEIDCKKHPYSCISEQLYMDQADRMVADGYMAAGYKSVHIDDCWMEHQRDNSTGRLVADKERFPSGIKKLADYMHQRGLKLGIYEDWGTKTCAGYPGTRGHEKVDMDTFAEWGCDYLKLDGCYSKIEDMPKGYPLVTKLLNATGRPIVYSCSWPAYVTGEKKDPNYTAIAKNCNLWRNYNDISAKWSSIASIIEYYSKNQDELAMHHGPGQWNDPDMLVVGETTVTVDQAKAQMTIWSIWSAPLIMSNDLRRIAPVFRDILQNPDVIAINQDEMGIFGKRIVETAWVDVYTKNVTPSDTATGRNSVAFALLNRHTSRTALVQVGLSRIGLDNPTGYFVKELWSGKHYGLMNPSNSLAIKIPSTGAVLFKATLAQATNIGEFPDANFFRNDNKLLDGNLLNDFNDVYSVVRANRVTIM